MLYIMNINLQDLNLQKKFAHNASLHAETRFYICIIIYTIHLLHLKICSCTEHFGYYKNTLWASFTFHGTT